MPTNPAMNSPDEYSSDINELTAWKSVMIQTITIVNQKTNSLSCCPGPESICRLPRNVNVVNPRFATTNPMLPIRMDGNSPKSKWRKLMTSKERKPGVKAMNIRHAILNWNEALIGSRELAKMAIIPVNPARPIENSQMMPRDSMMLDMTPNVQSSAAR